MTIRTRFATGFLTVIAAPLWAAVTAEPTQKQLDFFENKIRPILAENCYKCHSIEAGKAKGELTLDTKGGWEKGGETGKAIVPGTPEKSLLYTALTYKDDDLRMPPTSSGGKLSDQQIADIAEWIRMGAPDPRKEAKKAGGKLSGLTDSARSHWAYRPVTNPKVPVNKNQQWCRTPIDCFILQKLESKAMLPSPDADRETLLRRVSYDLTGLPPTFAEVMAFENDTAPNAFEKVVDRLLASPAYGERWARHWLDTARYSDTIGGDRNAARTTEYRYPDAWTYRDYVIRSLNEDKPYTDFITEQLAADKIPGIHPNDPRLAALGFLTVGERFKNVNDIINDRIDVVSKGFLALTVSCARCHDHMFDPIPTKDYYALHGVFTSITEPDQKPLLGTRVTSAQREDYQQKYKVLLGEMRNRYFDAVDYYLGEIQRAPAAYIRAAMLASGKKDAAAITARNELIKKNDLDEQFVGYFTRGMLRNPDVWGPLLSYRGGMATKVKKLKVARANSDAAKTSDGRMKGGTNPYVEKAFTEKQPKNLDEAIAVYAELLASVGPKAKGFIPAMKAAVSQTVPGYEDPALLDLLRGPFEVAPAPLIDLDWAQDAQQGWPNKMLGRARLNYGDINMLETSHPGAPAHAMVVQDKDRPVNSPIFIRGQSETKGDIVPRGFLEILSPGQKPVEFSQGSGRYELAKCIADRSNPLTARVLVNRVWLHHFGEGFVRTPDDLGVMAEKPTHPELIDYLANWFMDSGWSLKKLHKFIVMSRVYQVSSHTRPEYEVIDPENRMLWRANVRRLDFEAMRDSLLVYSGDLERQLGGKPINLTEEPYSYRRSVYGYVDRGNLPELMAHFDFSDPDMPNSKRATSLVPQQALFFMNSPMAVDVARKILTRPEVVRQPGDLYRINAIYRVIFQRMPNPREVRMALAFIEMENKLQTETAADAGSLVNASVSDTASKKGKTKKPGTKKKNDSNFGAIQNEGTGVVRSVLSPWETFVQALLFSNEAAYVN